MHKGVLPSIAIVVARAHAQNIKYQFWANQWKLLRRNMQFSRDLYYRSHEYAINVEIYDRKFRRHFWDIV